MCHERRVIQIKVRSAAQLRNNEIDRRQQSHSQLRLANKVGRTLTIPWRHRHNGPPREIFGEVCWDLVPSEESSQRLDRTRHFRLHIARQPILIPVSLERKRPHEQDIDSSTSLPGVVRQKRNDVISGERRQRRGLRQRHESPESR